MAREHDPLERERSPERRCIATGVSGTRTELIRFVVGPDQTIVPDVTGRLPGRGIWLSASREAVELALKKRLFQRAARAPVAVSADLADRLEALLVRQLQNALGLAYKAGAVHPGFAKTEALLAKGRAIALLEARDAARHGALKLRSQAAKSDIPVLSLLTAEEMGLALGRGNVVHAALGAERLARRVLEEARRLAGFRSDPSMAGPSTPMSESEET